MLKYLLLLLAIFSLARGQMSEKEQTALIAFWNGLTYNAQLNWDTTQSLCGQTGVVCGNGNVTEIHFSQTQITGTISTQIGQLTALNRLDLSWNQLSGTIPTEVGLLSQLTILYFNQNKLSGELPTQIGLISSLQYLSFSSNQFTGSIPPEYGLLTSLSNIWFDDNKFSGKLPKELFQLPLLTSISLNSNQFFGEIPTEVGNLSNLNYLVLSGNYLNGTIPTEVGKLSLLSGLFIDTNHLTGSLPSEIGQIPYLQTLNLYSNYLSGSIPTEIGFLHFLQQIDLSNNQLSGSIPTEIAMIPPLRSLLLSGNQMSGGFPNITSLSLLQLDLSGNQFTGTLPTEIGSFQNVNNLLLSNNKFTGFIPTQIGELLSLQQLELNNNQFYGTIPSELSLLSNLQNLKLAQNQLCPIWDYSSLASTNDYASNTLPCEACPVNVTICQNGGVCAGGLNSPFSCSCQGEYFGFLCDQICSSNSIYFPNVGCSCLSGFTGELCDSDQSLTCSPLPTIAPLITEPVAEFMVNQSSISSSVFSFVIESPARNMRYFESISLTDPSASVLNSSCSYPGSNIAKGFLASPDCKDTFTGSFSIPELHDSCHFTPSSDSSFTYLDGKIQVVVKDNLGTFRGHLIQRTTKSYLGLQLKFPSAYTLTTPTNLTISSPVNVLAAVTLQSYDPMTDQAIIEITTSVQWPYILSNSVLYFNSRSDFNNTLVSIQDSSCPQGTDGSDCLQITRLVINQVQTTSCNFDGEYGFEWNYGCRSGLSTPCPVDGTGVSNTNTTLVSGDLCGQVTVVSHLSGSLKAYSDSRFNQETVAFLANSRIYLKATMGADVDIMTVQVNSVNVIQSGTPTLIVNGGVAQSPYSSAINYNGTETVSNSNEAGFSFVLTTGTKSAAIFQPGGNADAVFSFSIEVLLDVTYKTSFAKKKRDILTERVSLTANAVLVQSNSQRHG